MTFRAKYDKGSLPALAVFLLLFALALRHFHAPFQGPLIAAFVVMGLLWCWPHRYEVREGCIYMWAGRVAIWRVRLCDVRRIEPRRVWPFLSHLLRPTAGLRLKMAAGQISLIPEDVGEFVAELKQSGRI